MKYPDFKPKGLIFDFDGVFTSNTVYVNELGIEMVRSSRFDGLGLDILRKLALPHVVISTEKNPVVAARCLKLKINCIQSCEDKVVAGSHWSKKNGLDISEVLFLGNDINDIDLLRTVGYPCCVADCWPEIENECLYRTKRNGGDGAVREICEMIAHNYALNV